MNDGQPSSETQFDTARIQAALNSCGSGKAVELTASGANDAFLLQPITLPSGVTLLVDAGVTVFASRNPADYQKNNHEACGTVGHKGDGCRPLILSNGTTGAGIMGYGVIDGRGGDQLIVNGAVQSDSWYSNTRKAYVPRPVLDQNNFDMVRLIQASNFTFYKITLKNSPKFNIHWRGENGAPPTRGLTIWGIKIIAPHDIANTDGIDPTDNATDITIRDSFLSVGDDNIAISTKAPDNPVANISIINLHTYAGFGVSIGSQTQGGIHKVLVDTLNQSGEPADKGSAGIKIKSSSDRGGPVDTITYQHVCQQNERAAIRIWPFYTKPSTTAHIPTFSNILLRDVTILAGATGNPGSITLQGFDANHKTTLTLDNVNVQGMPDLSSEKPQYTTITVAGPVTPAALMKMSGSGMSYLNLHPTATRAPYACSGFQKLTGELLLSTANADNLQSLTVNAGAPFILKAVVAPAAAEYPSVSGSVTFYDGTTVAGTAALGGNGTLATLTLSGVPVGTHTYTARYADSNYPAFSFGSVTVNVTTAALQRKPR